jgi:hypothetical protein
MSTTSFETDVMNIIGARIKVPSLTFFRGITRTYNCFQCGASPRTDVRCKLLQNSPKCNQTLLTAGGNFPRGREE